MNMTESWARRVLVLLCLLGACRALADLPPAPAAAAGSEAIPVTPPEPVIFPLPPPVIWLAPHANTSLNWSVAVCSQLTCRWRHEGRPLAGAAGSRLDITDFKAAQAGVYTLEVSNPYGSTKATTVLRLLNSPVVQVDGAIPAQATVTRTNTAEITLSSGFGSDAAIYYTLDGSDPDFTATLYAGAFPLYNSATVRAMAYNFAHSQWAEAAPVRVEIWPAYPLHVTTAGPGSVHLSPASVIATNYYPSNAVVQLTATATNGWGFIAWSGDITADAATTTVLMDRPREVQAVFGQFPLLATTRGGGTIHVSPRRPQQQQYLRGPDARHAHRHPAQGLVVHSLDRGQHRHQRGDASAAGSTPIRAGGLWRSLEPLYQRQRAGAGGPADRPLLV